MSEPVATMTAARVQTVGFTLHTRKPYRTVRLTQMKWKGTVSQVGKVTMPTRLATANAPHARSIQYALNGQRPSSESIDPISLAPNGDQRVGPQLGSEPSHVDVDHVR